MMRLRKEPAMRKLIQRRRVQSRTRSRRLSPSAEIHQNERIAEDVDIFRQSLDLLARKELDLRLPLHLLQFTTKNLPSVSGQVRDHP